MVAQQPEVFTLNMLLGNMYINRPASIGLLVFFSPGQDGSLPKTNKNSEAIS